MLAKNYFKVNYMNQYTSINTPDKKHHIKKIFARAWHLRHEFTKYFIIGFSSFLLDVGSLYILKNHIDLKPYIAVMINQPLILLYIFFLNKHWSFKADGFTRKQMMRFLCVAGMNYIISAAWMWTFNEKFGLQYIIARTLNVIVAVGWNFMLYKYWVYRTEVLSTKY